MDDSDSSADKDADPPGVGFRVVWVTKTAYNAWLARLPAVPNSRPGHNQHALGIAITPDWVFDGDTCPPSFRGVFVRAWVSDKHYRAWRSSPDIGFINITFGSLPPQPPLPQDTQMPLQPSANKQTHKKHRSPLLAPVARAPESDSHDIKATPKRAAADDTSNARKRAPVAAASSSSSASALLPAAAADGVPIFSVSAALSSLPPIVDRFKGARLCEYAKNHHQFAIQTQEWFSDYEIPTNWANEWAVCQEEFRLRDAVMALVDSEPDMHRKTAIIEKNRFHNVGTVLCAVRRAVLSQ